MRATLVKASYVEEAQSVLYLIEKDGKQQPMQKHRKDIATFGNRTEEEIIEAMHNYVAELNKIYQGKEINLERAEK